MNDDQKAIPITVFAEYQELLQQKKDLERKLEIVKTASEKMIAKFAIEKLCPEIISEYRALTHQPGDE